MGHAQDQGTDPGAAAYPGAGEAGQSAGAGEDDTKKGYRSLNVRRDESLALIDKLREHESAAFICDTFQVARSTYYDYKKRRSVIDVERLRLRSQVNELFNQSRASAGSRTIVAMLQDRGTDIGRFKVRGLMREAGLICKQPGSHKYKHATVERLDIPNRLNREFDIAEQNQVWCGDITFIWAQGRWHYLAVVLDLHRR